MERKMEPDLGPTPEGFPQSEECGHPDTSVTSRFLPFTIEILLKHLLR